MRRYGIATVAIVIFGLAAMAFILINPLGGDAQAQTNLQVGVGVGDGTVAGNVYAPGEFTVAVGDSVTFEIQSDEPHSITFGAGPEGVSPDEWDNTYGAIPDFTPQDLGNNDYDGTGFLNTGIIVRTSTASVTFTEPGSYDFFCVIHDGMTGTVDVVDEGEDTTSQEEADAAAAETQTAILDAVAPLEQSVLDSVETETRSDGTKIHKIFTNSVQDPAPQPGGGIGYLELLRFVPPELDITAGDTVVWQATSFHTVTFLGEDSDPSMLDPFAPGEKPSDEYDGKSLYNSGFLGPPGVGLPSEFELTFPDAGEFPYLCLLHGELGQVGTIKVAEAPGSLPGTGGPPDSGGTDYTLWLTVAAGLAAAFASLILLKKQLR